MTYPQLASPPLSGSFVIECILPNGDPVITADTPVNASIATIKTNIETACPRYKDKISVYDNLTYVNTAA